jgi:hypothetical protein
MAQRRYAAVSVGRADPREQQPRDLDERAIAGLVPQPTGARVRAVLVDQALDALAEQPDDHGRADHEPAEHDASTAVPTLALRCAVRMRL